MTVDAFPATDLSDTLLTLLRAAPGGSSEYQLIQTLRADGNPHLSQRSLQDPLVLFRTHFLVFNALYRLRERLWREQAGHLEISPLRIRLLRRLTLQQAYDVIHADQLSMAWWGQLAAGNTGPAAARGARPRTLLDEHNALYALTGRMADEAQGLRRLVARREAGAFRRYEADMLRRYDRVLTVTREDRDLLLELLPEALAAQAEELRRAPARAVRAGEGGLDERALEMAARVLQLRDLARRDRDASDGESGRCGRPPYRRACRRNARTMSRGVLRRDRVSAHSERSARKRGLHRDG